MEALEVLDEAIEEIKSKDMPQQVKSHHLVRLLQNRQDIIKLDHILRSNPDVNLKNIRRLWEEDKGKSAPVKHETSVKDRKGCPSTFRRKKMLDNFEKYVKSLIAEKKWDELKEILERIGYQND